MSPYSIPEEQSSVTSPIRGKRMITIVNHLHVVTSTSLADPVTARLAVDLSSGCLEDLLDMRPGGRGSTGHEGRTVASTLLTTGDAGADEEEALGLELLGAADRVWVVRVTTIDDDIALLEVRDELLDEVIDSWASLDEEDDLAGGLELLAELLNRPRALDLGALAGGKVC
jgi:hypothetical protein